jgi:nucleoside triphosphate diphosphatase
MLELLAIMERLRAPDGCPWDREQTFATIAPYTIEEAYEVADAIEREDLPHLKDELGDLLFQVVFHAQIARERGAFDFEAAAGAICDKLKRRHPHVFSGQGCPAEGCPAEGRPSAAEQSVLWENIKAVERSDARRAAADATSALDGVPRALPALMRAYKLSKRAARVGFDFEHASQTADKVAEELAEVREAAAAHESAGRDGANGSPSAGPSEEIFEEMGDLLFAAANLARKLDVDAEAALRAANAKFERRFRAMEELARARGEVFSSLSLAAQEGLWLDVKRAE